MTMAFLAEMLWKSALIAGAALLLLRLLRAQAPADRANVLRLSIVVLLALPAVAVIAPAVKIAVLPAEPVALFTHDRDEAMIPQTRPLADDPLPPGSAFADETTTWDDPAPLVALLYAGGVLMVLARLFAGLWTLRRWTAEATPVRDAMWLNALERHRAASGASSKVRLLETVECGSPLSWGFLNPVILIDRDRIESGEDADGILAHELAHIARRDWLMLMLMHVATALFWFNPLVWWLQQETIQQSEEAADAHALQCSEPARYAQMLLSYADYATAGVPANCMAPARGLTRRVTAILAHGMSAVRPRRRWAMAAMLACVGVAAPISAAKLVAAQAEKADDAKAAKKPAITSTEWAAAAGVPVASVAPKAPVSPVAPASPLAPTAPAAPEAPMLALAPLAPLAPVSPAMPVPPAPPMPPAPAAWEAHAVAYADAGSLREIAEARREAARADREARREAAQAAREAEIDVREAARDAARDAEDARREAEDDRRDAEHESWTDNMAGLGARISSQVNAAIDSRAIAVAVHDGVADGMRSGAVGMEEGARKMRAEAQRMRDPAYRQRLIAEQRRRHDHVNTDAELLAAIPKMEHGADRMMEGAQRMREGAVRQAEGERRAADGQARAREGMKRGAERMMVGAERMDRGAERMLTAARNLRDPEYRRKQIERSRGWGDAQSDAELLSQIPELERGARDMRRQAQQMREQAKSMATT